MSCSLQAARRVLLVALALVMAASLVRPGWQPDDNALRDYCRRPGRRDSRRRYRRQEQRHERHIPGCQRPQGEFVCRPPARHLHADGVVDGFKTFVSPDVKCSRARRKPSRSHCRSARWKKPCWSRAPPRWSRRRRRRSRDAAGEAAPADALATHTALDYIVSLPGVNVNGSNNSRAATINNLPNRAMNITMDGINVQDNRTAARGSSCTSGR